MESGELKGGLLLGLRLSGFGQSQLTVAFISGRS
jgi:hypothetical protein